MLSPIVDRGVLAQTRAEKRREEKRVTMRKALMQNSCLH